MRRLLRWLLVVGVLAGIGVAVWYGSTLSGMPWMPKAAYRTAAVSRGRVETVVNSTGTVKPVQSVSIGASVSGPIKEIFVDFNSVVKEGQLLARIDPRLLQAAVDRDQATLGTQKAEQARVEALLKQARNNEERARKLMKMSKDYISDTEMDQYYYTKLSQEAQLDLAKASVLQAEASLKNSETNLKYTEIVSPVDGMVIERKV